MYKSNLLSVFIFLLLIVFSCKSESNDDKGSTTSDKTNVQKEEQSKPLLKLKEGITIYCWVDNLRIRNAPDTDSAVLGELKEGESLSYLDEQSDHYHKINLRGRVFEEPWVKIKTRDGVEGWVFGGGVKFYSPKVDVAPSVFSTCEEMQYNGKMDAYKDCLNEKSNILLGKYKRFVTVGKNSLEVNLLNGEKVMLLNGDGQQYAFRDYIAKMGLFVFEKTTASGSSHLLINDKSGTKTEIWGTAKASPDNKNLLVVNAKPGADNNGIQLWGFTDNGFSKLFEENLGSEAAYLPKWLNVNKLQVTVKSPGSSSSKIKKIQMSANGNWVSS